MESCAACLRRRPLSGKLGFKFRFSYSDYKKTFTGLCRVPSIEHLLIQNSGISSSRASSLAIQLVSDLDRENKYSDLSIKMGCAGQL